MFDPERDFDPGAGSFYGRIVAIALLTAGVCVAAWPSVSGFAAGPDHNTGCVAIVNGWHGEPSAPSAADVAAAQAAFPAPPTAAQAVDRGFMDQWQARMRAAGTNPAVIRANARLDWLNGPGVCVPASRHRLLRSATLLGGVALAALAVWFASRAARAARMRRFAAFTTA